MDKNSIKKIIHGRTQIRIGKSGMNEGVIKEVNTQIKKLKAIKIKFLEISPFDTTKEAVEHLSQLTNTNIADIRGNTCVLIK